MAPDFDAISIGGGLAGSAFAIVLANAGKRVAIIERSPTARLKVCGDFLSREAQDLLLALGCDIHQLGALPVTRLRVASRQRAAVAPLPFVGAGLTRLTLDEALLARAQESGAVLIRGSRATGLDLRSGLPGVLVGDRRYTAGRVALATGKHNLRGCGRPIGSVSAYKMTFRLSKQARTDLEETVQLVAFSGGYLGACNVENGASTLCWLADPERLKSHGGGWRAQLSHLARTSPFIECLVAGAEALTEKPVAVSGLPFGFRRHQPIHPNVYAVGDQLAVIPSFTGDGTSIALSSGIAAAEAILNGEDSPAFHREFLRRLSRQFRWAKAADFAFGNARARSLALEAIAVCPSLATGLASLTRLRDVGRL